MAQINPQDYVLVARIIESSLFILNFTLLTKKMSQRSEERRPFLSKLLCLAILGWVIYSVLDIIIYSFGAASFDLSVFTSATGYDISYPSLFIANILRDFSLSGALANVWIIFLSQFVILYGEERGKKIIKNKILLGCIIIFSGIIVYLDQIAVGITPSLIIVTSIGPDTLKYVLLILPLSLYSYTAIRITFLVHQNSKNLRPQKLETKLKYIAGGILLMSIGYIWYLIWAIVRIFSSVTDNLNVFLLVNYILHTFFTISPFLIYQAFKMKSEEEKK